MRVCGGTTAFADCSFSRPRSTLLNDHRVRSCAVSTPRFGSNVWRFELVLSEAAADTSPVAVFADSLRCVRQSVAQLQQAVDTLPNSTDTPAAAAAAAAHDDLF